jgi:hypothetical protein
MKKEITYYYWINDLKRVGKLEQFRPYLYDRNNGWVQDKEHILMDRLFGYDEYEPKDSPYAMGCSDMMDRIDGITQEEAMKLIGEML